MDSVTQFLKDLSEILSWQITILLIIFFARKHLGSLFAGLQNILNRTTKITVDGQKIVLEAMERIIETQKETIQHKEEELQEKEKEIIDYSNGAVQRAGKSDLSFAENFRTLTELDKSDKKSKKPNVNFDPNDPQKGQWGGQSSVNGKKLSAIVTPFGNATELFKIILTVESINPFDSITDIVVFHLHPTFINPVTEVKPINGVAKLNLIAYGAFTVGVQVGKTKLELDLAEDKNFPQLFRER